MFTIINSVILYILMTKQYNCVRIRGSNLRRLYLKNEKTIHSPTNTHMVIAS